MAVDSTLSSTINTCSVAIDLCCGDGGFTDGLTAAGFNVVGIDTVRFPGWKGAEFIQADMMTITAEHLRTYCPVVIFAGPPCEQFSRHGMPWTRKNNPPPPDLKLVEHTFQLAKELGVPIVLENVKSAQPFIGKATAHYGPHYLWGDVPAMLPDPTMYSKRPKESFSSTQRHLRARVPFELAYYLAQCFKPLNCVDSCTESITEEQAHHKIEPTPPVNDLTAVAS
jgi:hypothetical protein